VLQHCITRTSERAENIALIAAYMDYLMNLELSQERALSVATYCLQMPQLSQDQLARLQDILTAKGRSYSDPIYNADGSINMDSSRRVEFKFRLKDSEMIDEIREILSGHEN